MFTPLAPRFILLLAVLIWVGTATASVLPKIGHIGGFQPSIPMAVHFVSEHCVQSPPFDPSPATPACDQYTACVGTGVSLSSEGYTPFIFQVPASITFRDSTPFIHDHFSVPLLRPPLI